MCWFAAGVLDTYPVLGQGWLGFHNLRRPWWRRPAWAWSVREEWRPTAVAIRQNRRAELLLTP